MNLTVGRRRLLTVFCGAAAAWSVPSLAQRAGDARTIGFIMGLTDDAEAKLRVKAFEDGLKRWGWAPGQNLRIEYRFSGGNANRIKAYVKEIIALRPDVIVGHSTPVVREIISATREIPIIFVVVADPVGGGFAQSIAHPGGNATGFTNLDSPIAGKLLTILKQITPRLSHVGIMFNPDTVARGGLFYLRPFEAAAPAFSVQPVVAEVRTPADIERNMSQLAREAAPGLIVMPDNFTTVHRQLIIALAAQWRIPAIYPYRYYVDGGGLLSYGVDLIDLFRRAAEYVNRVLHGANPANLPIQAPTKFELVINLKTASSLGLAVPKILLAAADSLIE